MVEVLNCARVCCSDGKGKDSKSTLKAELWRLKWNWLYVILLSSLGTINTSSPLGTLHQFVTNPSDTEASTASLSMYEPGLGGSESLYAWSISANNIGGFLGGLLGIVFSSVMPFWYGFLGSLLCHVLGFLLYGLARYGWMMVISRLLAGVFTGLQRALAFSYFGVSYQHYVSVLEREGLKESKSFCRVKDVLFALFTISTSVGLLVGASFSAIIARVPNIDHFRAVGWYNLSFGVLMLILLVFTFHGECSWAYKGCVMPQLKLSRIWNDLCQPKLYLVVFLIFSTAVVKARISVYEELFNPVLSDSFGFSEDVTVYFFLLVLVAPILGGILLMLLEWTRMSNLMISILGILATVLGLLVMVDWQAIPYDPCLDYSVFHHPELLSNYSSHIEPMINMDEDCVWINNGTGLGSSSARLEVVLDPLSIPFSENIECDLEISQGSCKQCNKTLDSQLFLRFLIESDKVCYHPEQFSSFMDSTVNVVCKFQNSSCISMCYPYENSEVDDVAQLQSTESLIAAKSRSYVELAYVQSVHILQTNQYYAARNVCEDHQSCHWIPDSPLVNEHCVDCQPICRGLGRTLDFIQFVIGSLWFMFTVPIAEVSLPIVISDAVSKEYQGLAMSITVAATELLQGVTPLWLNEAYEAVQKRTFLPLLILVGTILPCLGGLMILYAKAKAKKSVDHNSEGHEKLIKSDEDQENSIDSDIAGEETSVESDTAQVTP